MPVDIAYLAGRIDPPKSGGEIYHNRISSFLRRNYSVANVCLVDAPPFVRRSGPALRLWFAMQLAALRPRVVIECSSLRGYLKWANRIVKRSHHASIVAFAQDLYIPDQHRSLVAKDQRLIRSYLNSADLIIVNSRFLKEQAISFDAPDRNIHVVAPAPFVIPMGGERQDERTNGRPSVACVGKIQRLKGQKHFIDAVGRIGELDFDVYLAGEEREKDYAQSVKELIRTKQLTEKVHLLGILGPDELAELYSKVTVVVAPSTYEAYGMSIVEAMAFGRAVIASNVGGIPDIIQNGVNGILVPPGDTQALAAALRSLVEFPETAEALGRNAKASSPCKRTWQNVGEEFVQVLQPLLSR